MEDSRTTNNYNDPANPTRPGDGMIPPPLLRDGLPHSEGNEPPPLAGAHTHLEIPSGIHPPMVLPINNTTVAGRSQEQPAANTSDNLHDVEAGDNRELPPRQRLPPGPNRAPQYQLPLDGYPASPAGMIPNQDLAQPRGVGVYPAAYTSEATVATDDWRAEVYQRGQHPVSTDHRAQRLPPPPPHYPHPGDYCGQPRYSEIQQLPPYYVPRRPPQVDSHRVHSRPYGPHHSRSDYAEAAGQTTMPQHQHERGQPVGDPYYPPRVNATSHGYPQQAQLPPYFDALPPTGPAQLQSLPSPFYVPRKRGMSYYGWCEGCGDYRCAAQIAIKEYDSAERVVASLKPRTIFKGPEDTRSGTSFIETMYTETEGHPDVVRYLWLKRYTTSYVWSVLTDGIQPPTRCHRSYGSQLQLLIDRLRHHYDTLGHVQRTSDDLAHCVQGGGTVYRFIQKLETMASELYALGSPVPYRDLKLRLHKGLKSILLRQRLDVDLMNDHMSFEQFRDRVLLHHKQLTNYYGVDYETNEGAARSPGFRPVRTQARPNYARTREQSVESRGGQSSHRDYTPRSSPSPARPRPLQPRSVNIVDEDTEELSEDEHSLRHLLAIRNDVTGFLCFRCHQKGHSAKNCLQAAPAELATRCKVCGNPGHTTDACRVNVEQIVCHRCNNPGHLAYVCGAKLPATAKTTKDPLRRPPTPSTRGAQPRPATKVRANTSVHATFLDDEESRSDHHCHTLRCTPPLDARVQHREGMMTGYITLEDTEVVAIYDTGADVSLITAECLNYVSPDAAVNTNVPSSLSAANGGHLHTIGTVRLRLSTPSTSQVDTFLVTTVPLTTPVILGCPTMSLLKTRITIGPDGYHIETNYCDTPKTNKVGSDDHVQHMEGDHCEDPPKDHDDYITNYKIKYINQLCLQEGCEPLRYNGLDLPPTTPWFSILYPGSVPTTINDDSLIRGQGRCNHGTSDTTTINQVQAPSSSDHGENEINGSLPPNNNKHMTVVNYDEDDLEEQEDQLQDEDNLPPWEALRRDWVYDETTPLGRAVVRASWKDSTRPPMNYRQAAARGSRCTKRLTSAQQEAFQQALKTYIDRGFCTIVQNNAESNYSEAPLFDACQDAWDSLTKGTHYEGTTVIKPKHFTPAHTVFRDNHPTTPCRIVLDYRVLNKYLLRGGRTQNDLQGTLLLLRGFNYFVSSDISKAFCQMKASLYDLAYANYTCIGDYTILWSSISFGTTNAPNFLECCTYDVTTEIEALQEAGARLSTSPLVDPRLLTDDVLEEVLLLPSRAAFDYIRQGPAIPKDVILLKYVDDLFNGGDTPEQATQANDLSLHMLGGHGFKAEAIKNVRSWSEAVTTDTKAKSLLGYHYRDENLFVVYSGKLPDGVITKREACSALASLYDPLGVFIELDLKGRLLWRCVCEDYKDWSDSVDTNVANDIRSWITECTMASTIGTPRLVQTNPLLVCTDASQDLWGVDIRTMSTTTISSRLLGRGGVFPKPQTPWTIPRKELVALCKGLQLLKLMSLYLPVPTYHRPHQVPLDALAPTLQPRQTRLLCDSEITIYRLRRPANDKRLPAVERRRLIEVRKLCKELNVIILHVPSELNYADSISRARTTKVDIDASAVLNSMTTSSVIYDYRCQYDESAEGDAVEQAPTNPSVSAINEDGIDLPEVDPLPNEQRLELLALMNYAKPTERIDSGQLEDSRFTTCVNDCVLRAQRLDEDTKSLKAILEGKSTTATLGVRATRLHRLSKVCFLDDDGLLRRYPDPRRATETSDEKGLLHLGRTLCSAFLVRVLAVIFHYWYGHLGAKRVHLRLRRDYWRDSMFRLVRLTIGSCIPCLRARATRQHNYLVTRVQSLLTEGLWQIVGADIAGPYGKPSTVTSSTSNAATPSEGSTTNHYLLLVHDYVSGFTVARPLRDTKSTTVAAVLDNIFLEHGSPAVLLTDGDRTILSGKAVKLTLARHGTRHYRLPPYSYYLGFWERAHRDFVEVTRALRASRPITGPDAPARTTESNSYISDYMVAVRAYNNTPRQWANVSPWQLHYGYSSRLPGLHPEMDSSVDWGTLDMHYAETNIVDFVQTNVPLLTEAKEKMETTLGEYLELWRIKQQRHLERYTLDNPNDYEPTLFDLVFVAKRSNTTIGNHLGTYWRGPYTVVELQGSAIVKVIHGILIEGLGGVEANSDRTTAHIPVAYGASESFSLKNVTHAKALQEVVSNYHQKSQRAYLDSDGTLRTMRLTTPSQPDDCRRVSRARDRTALRHANLPVPSPIPSEDGDGAEATTQGVSLSPGSLAEELDSDQPGEYASPPATNSPTIWATPSPEEVTEEAGEDTTDDREPAEELSDPNYVDVTARLRDYFGTSTRHLFGKFMNTSPTVGSVVISTTAPHIGLATVVDNALNDGYIRLQALDVVSEGSHLCAPQYYNVDSR
ncbi:hypothetical protein FOZ63_028678 [Perkinsus olseni]|uniref:Uncharacterized protein n=1 Tax=Perkinsus olseni TaxID=32597 RepID=A0A7J6SD12_PEROL|nr:hypothetical protein FOZ63_028678 [Perkinsus olseni]